MSNRFSWEWSLEEFLARSASASPTPGGGSVAAYSGALGFSMLCMVANLTVGKEKYRDVQEEVAEILAAADEGLRNLKDAVTEDIRAFDHVMSVYKMPKDTEADRSRRGEELERALHLAASAPLAAARVCLDGLRLAGRLAPIGNRGAISDVGVAACLLESALQAAMFSVDINVQQMRDEGFLAEITKERTFLLKESEVLKGDVLFCLGRKEAMRC